jgi:hypothetical protein
MADDELNEFLFPGTIWFVAPKSAHGRPAELRAFVLRGLFNEKDSGATVPIIYVFSDSDLAERYLERTAKRTGQSMAHYRPVSLPDDQLISFLEGLKSDGCRYVGADAEALATSVLSIERVIEQVRNRQNLPPSDTGRKT